MPKIFCPNCYAANEYSNRPAKFCGECGQAFTESSASVPPQNKPVISPAPAPARTLQPLPNRLTKLKTRRAQVEEEYDESEFTPEDDVIVPEIDELQIEIQGNLRPNVNSFKDISGSNKSGNPKRLGRPPTKSKPLSKKQIEQNWQKQFSQTRQPKDIS